VREALSEVVDFITPPEKIEDVLKGVKAKVWLDEKRTPIYFKDILQYSGSEIWNKEDPCLLPRACKNKSEQNAMKRAHLRDAKAFIQFEKWLYENWQGQTELSVEKKLEEFRAQAPEFKEPSFNTIAGYGEHGAIVHYRATDKSNVALQGDSLFLLDSGAQYLDGTTDITRTYCFGTPTEDMKKSYTLVLKGHIALASAVFKKGTTGKEIDVLARQYLREHGMDYAHGTGHGVGCYLSVHEEAAGLSPRGDRPLEEGMILSNEPGYYKEGEYGIRIENLVLVKEYDDKHFCFETITLVPIATNLIDEDLMTEDEVKWLEEYHVRVDRARA
jgi:Xaa-Pro aminopeptidase